MILFENLKFLFSLFLGEIGRRELFADVLDRRQRPVDYKKPLFKINKVAKFVFYQRGLSMIFVRTCNFFLLIIVFFANCVFGLPFK